MESCLASKLQGRDNLAKYYCIWITMEKKGGKGREKKGKFCVLFIEERN